jgi:hypothetical protein
MQRVFWPATGLVLPPQDAGGMWASRASAPMLVMPVTRNTAPCSQLDTTTTSWACSPSRPFGVAISGSSPGCSTSASRNPGRRVPRKITSAGPAAVMMREMSNWGGTFCHSLVAVEPPMPFT